MINFLLLDTLKTVKKTKEKNSAIIENIFKISNSKYLNYSKIKY